METFEKRCIEICKNHLFSKESNQKKLVKFLLNYSKGDENKAFYYLYEILTEYHCNTNIENVLDIIINKKLEWNHPMFENLKFIQKENDDYLLNPPEVEEGVIECRKCHSKKTFSFSKQTRRADESATVFVRCSNCQHTFKM